jgi:cytochrome c551/c552
VPPEAPELRAGLIASYRSLAEGGGTLHRIDPKPAFALGVSSPHPRLAPGPFAASWRGILEVGETDAITFSVRAGGEVVISVGGGAVLTARGEGQDAWIAAPRAVDLASGLHPIEIEYRSLSGVPGRLQIFWEGKTFSREPLPAWRLWHDSRSVPARVREEEALNRGRAAARRYGCAVCHASALPGVEAGTPGPAVAGWGDSMRRDWLLDWLDDPASVRAGAHMPTLFASTREGFAERWLVAEHLLGVLGDAVRAAAAKTPAQEPNGDHRPGRRAFIQLGCAACHPLPDLKASEQPALDRAPLVGLGDRMSLGRLAAAIESPQHRYPDGRMPRLPLSGAAARDIAAYLLLWSSPRAQRAESAAPSPEEIASVLRRLAAKDHREAAEALIREKRCGSCHAGLPEPTRRDLTIVAWEEARGCLSAAGRPRFAIEGESKRDLVLYLAAAGQERHPSPFAARQRRLAHFGCWHCHARDTLRPPPLEEAGSTLGGSNLETVPYQRSPRLTEASRKFTAAYLLAAVRDGVSGTRPARYTYRMPAYGEVAEEILRALAEGDGELVSPEATVEGAPPLDPTLAGLGPRLAGFEGYACVACHLWDQKLLAEPDPAAIGPELTTATSRLRREWFERWLEDPARIHPGTPMPRFFRRGESAALASILDGDAPRQREALWAYFSLGKDAPDPRPLPPSVVEPPAAGAPPIVAQIPLHLADGSIVESITVLFPDHDAVVFDVARGAPRGFLTAARMQRSVKGRLRRFHLDGNWLEGGLGPQPVLERAGGAAGEAPETMELEGYDRLADGVRIRSRLLFGSDSVGLEESFRMPRDGTGRRLLREVRASGLPAGARLVVSMGDGARSRLDAEGVWRFEVPPPAPPPLLERAALPDPGALDGALERPGYRAIAFPRPKTPSGEDLVLPSALAVSPQDGRVFIASMKLGQVYVLDDPGGDGRRARFVDYAGGLFQEAFSMLAEGDNLYVLHRRNLTRLRDTDGDGSADRFDRVASLSHGTADTYDYGYGLAREPSGAFVFSFAPYANTQLPGSGGALRLRPGRDAAVEELAFGFRNPLGWCLGPEGAVFATDNQGEWVAANKLCHVAAGRFYGFPNPAQRQHAAKPPSKAAVWVPYSWARSINGVAYDASGGKFGPFAGQFFLAELMFGGGIIRASLERVNGEYQGACFPFWGKGLLGPLVLAFAPSGALYVGSITEPGWMAQPDRGALFRIDATGENFFEMRSIHVRPRGFRIVFTSPAAAGSLSRPDSYAIEHYRYEYTGAYGSPELDRTRLEVLGARPAPDGLAVDLDTAPLVKDRVYRISAPGVRSSRGEPLVHDTGVYTLNEIGEE